MDYLNTHFTSIADLDLLDLAIQDLETKRSEVVKQANSLLGGDGSVNGSKNGLETSSSKSSSVSLSPLLDDTFDTFLAEVLQTCEAQDALKFSELKAKYGDIEVLKALDALFDEKRKLEDLVSSLLKVYQIQQQEDLLHENVQDYKLFSIKIQQLLPNLDKNDPIWNNFELKKQSLRERLQKELGKKLQLIQWLSKNETIPSKFDPSEILSLVDQLIELQSINGPPQYPDSWWALDTLLEPFIIRFKYNFTSPKPTNKVSKPEWALEFVTEFLDLNSEYILLILGNSFSKFHRFPIYEIITAVLNPVRKKLEHDVQSIVLSIEQNPEDEKNGRILSHLIFELAKFDEILRSKYLYNPFANLNDKSPSYTWRGLTGDILSNTVDSWLAFEQRLTVRRFKELFKNDNAWSIDVDFLGKYKPTFSAYDIGKLFENVTAHHQTLSILKFQLKYVLRVQLNLLDLYAEELKGYYQKVTLKSVRSYIPGNMELKEIDQMPYLLHLCEVFCLAKYLNYKMASWNTELIFVQLWKSFIQISGEQDEKSFFDPYRSKFDHLIFQTSEKLNELIYNEVKLYLKEYVNHSEWDIAATHEVSPGVHGLTTKLPAILHQLNRYLSPTDYFIFSGKIVTTISSILREFIITNNRFSSAGRLQLQIDFGYIWQTFGELLFLSKPTKVGVSTEDETVEFNFTNLDNHEYLRTQQSIELLVSMESGDLRLFGGTETYGLLRERSGNGFDHLTDKDIYDLLHRVLA